MLKRILYWAISVLVPVILVLTAVRLLMSPAFLRLEYGMPNFPEDNYGFSQQDRLEWAPIALEYLLNDAQISFLGDLEIEDGSPLYNERELSHMVDVKVLTQQALAFWVAGLTVIVGLGIWAWRGDWWQDYKYLLARGGKITASAIGVLIIFVIISFNQIFIGFHRIFFEGDTWLFLYSDTLIRLFPMRFWQDVFISL
ncbi:MAG: TIGR01906 family membrane protein, partial [Chloroflexota bacterium]